MKSFLRSIVKCSAKILSYIPFDRIRRSFHVYGGLIASYRYQRKLNAGDGLRITTPIYLMGEKYIRIGKNFVAKLNLVLEAIDHYGENTYQPCIMIGDNFYIGPNGHIGAIHSIIIGDNVLIGSKVYISDHSHGSVSTIERDIPPAARSLCSKGAVVIGDNVWIGDNVVIMPGVTVGRGAIVGANAVVTRDIPDYAVAVGIPARVIKTL